MIEKTALFGAGSIGGVHVKELAGLSYLGCIIDTDPVKKEIAERYGVGFINEGVIKISDMIDINRDNEGNPISHSSLPQKKNLYSIRGNEDATNQDYWAKIEDKLYKKEGRFGKAIKTNNWDIATNTPSHFPLMLLGLDYGKNIFVEKPPAEKVSELEYIAKNYPDAKIGVDYIEMAHPVVQANKDDMDFEPKYSFNRRSKDLRGSGRGMGGGEGSRIILEDLVHDLSEVDLFRKYALGSSFAEKSPEVTNAKIQTWYELPEKENGNPKYPYSTDVRAEFALLFPDGTISEMEGGFADQEIRQYIVIDEDKKTAQYGNTLARPEINPIAARVEGKKNVEYLLEKVKGKIITDNEKQDEVLKRANAETLEEKMNKYVPEAKWVDGKPMYGWAPLYNMLDNFFKAESNKELICPLSQALEYQKIAEEVYHKAGRPEAMVYKVLGGDEK